MLCTVENIRTYTRNTRFTVVVARSYVIICDYVNWIVYYYRAWISSCYVVMSVDKRGREGGREIEREPWYLKNINIIIKNMLYIYILYI